jgi:hypothetical protein
VQLGDDIDGEAAGDFSGKCVALSSDGSIVAIGASQHDGNSGHVRIFEWNNELWSQLGGDIDGEAVNNYSGHSVALSSDGSIVAIGAPYDDGNGGNAGHVRIFKWNNQLWSQLGGDIDGEAAFNYSGVSVALSSDGSIVAISAPYNGGRTGHVRIFKLNNEFWSQLGRDIDGEAAGNFSSTSVALSSDGLTVALGAPNNSGNGLDAGHVRIFKWNTELWSQLGGDIDGEAAGDHNGRYVALSCDGSTVAVGAYGNDGNGSNAGHVRIFKWNNQLWSQLGGDIVGEAATDVSGWSLALSSDGSTVAIGAPDNNGNGSRAGHARIFKWNNGLWSQLGGDSDGEAAGDGSGFVVAISSDGSTVGIGAPYNDCNGGNSGHVRIFR